MMEFTKDPSSHPANGPLSVERLIRVRDSMSAAAKRSDGGDFGYMMADAAKAIDELLTRRPAPVVPDDMRNRIKAEGLAELLKDAREYAPLTAAQWQILAKNWHQTFIGLSDDPNVSRSGEPHSEPVVADESSCKYCGGSGYFRWQQSANMCPCPCLGWTEHANGGE